MIIGFDGNEANRAHRVGVGWYAYYLLQELAAKASSKTEVRVFLPSLPLADLPKETAHFKYIIVPKRTLWSQIDLPLALYLKHRWLSVFLSPAHYVPRFCPCPTVVVVHDLSYFYYPQDFLAKDLFQLQHWTAYSVKKARAVIAVSKLTKKDLVLNYHLPESKIKVVYNGFCQSKFPPLAPQFELKEPYFLALGTLQPRKNIRNLLLSFSRFKREYPQYSLYLVGKKGWLYQESLALITKLGLAKAVFVTDYLTESEKNYLLKNSQALLVPGFYEGFGQPILEGFAARVPVLCSNTGALPEIAREGALYFDPTDSKTMVTKMKEIAQNKGLRSSLVEKATSILTQYSWSKTLTEIFKVFETL